ncbi:MAG: hypothetical protein ACRESZ_22050 [Methylococcales bacterium]
MGRRCGFDRKRGGVLQGAEVGRVVGLVRGDIMWEVILEWLKKPRSVYWLGVSGAFAVTGYLLEGVHILKLLSDMTEAFRHSLESIDALQIASVFYYRLTGFEGLDQRDAIGVVCKGQYAWSHLIQYLHPGKLLGGLWDALSFST